MNVSIKQNLTYWPIVLLGLLSLLASPFISAVGMELLLLPDSWQKLTESQQYWRLLGTSFVHFTEMHLLTNIVVLVMLAHPVYIFSKRYFWAVMILCSLSGNLMEWYLVDAKFGGLSGACFGYFGFLFAYTLRHKQGSLFLNPLYSGLIWLTLLLTATDWFGHYAFYAHLGGTICGIALGLIAAKLNFANP